ncbi:MAG: hypothetical protein RIQ93_2339 [Verrucomicrobiota bacterium]
MRFYQLKISEICLPSGIKEVSQNGNRPPHGFNEYVPGHASQQGYWQAQTCTFIKHIQRKNCAYPIAGSGDESEDGIKANAPPSDWNRTVQQPGDVTQAAQPCVCPGRKVRW